VRSRVYEKDKSFITIFFILSAFKLAAQPDYTWWNQIHNWDGHTSWFKYLTFSPGYFGPNALPVPEVNKGMVYNKGTLELAFAGHFSKGDQTQNLFTKLYYPIVPRVVAVEFYVVPIEYFKMDTATRDIRAARIRSGEGTAGGDIYFATIIQLVKDKKNPEVVFRMTCRTASGTNVSAARYTDAPGYFFDLSMGKNFVNDNRYFNTIRPYWMIGFYCWQSNSERYRQDDAFLYGAGIDFISEKITVSASAGGYIGYVKNHDSPMVARLSVFRNVKHFNYGISCQAGLNDYPYKSVRISLVYNLPEKLMLKNCTR
jgi:hypothetical protein